MLLAVDDAGAGPAVDVAVTDAATAAAAAVMFADVVVVVADVVVAAAADAGAAVDDDDDDDDEIDGDAAVTDAVVLAGPATAATGEVGRSGTAAAAGG